MAARRPGKEQSFARYYLRHVAQSEGCGCAEHVLREARPLRAGDSLKEIIAALVERFGRVRTEA